MFSLRRPACTNFGTLDPHRTLKISLSRISRLRPQFVTTWAQFFTRTLFESARTLYDTIDSLNGGRFLIDALGL